MYQSIFHHKKMLNIFYQPSQFHFFFIIYNVKFLNVTSQKNNNQFLIINIIFLFFVIMRFILLYKYGILRTKTQRIDINHCQTTTQILQHLQKRIKQKQNNFIIKYKSGKHYLRIIPGWPLLTYWIKQGSQLHIEQINNDSPLEKNNQYINNKYRTNILGYSNRLICGEMETVHEQLEKHQEQSPCFFNIRKYLDLQCEKMLKEIQKKNTSAFKTLLEELPDDAPEDYLIEIKQKKKALINELGQKGWGPLHYAIFCQAIQILDILLQLDVDVNKCTSDGWLPIQLAIDIKSRKITQKLLDNLNINLGLVTSRGSAIHTAAKLGQKQILIMLLEKDIDIHLKDQTGKIAYEITADKQCQQLLKKYQENKQSYYQYIRGNFLFLGVSIFHGHIYKIKKPFMNLKQRYLLIDPFQGSMIRYQNIQDYPKKAKQIISLLQLNGIRIVNQEQKSWFMKKQLYYFIIEKPKKQIYACKYYHVAEKWINNLILAIKFAKQLQKDISLLSQVKRNQLIIEDIPHPNTNPKNKTKQINKSTNNIKKSLQLKEKKNYKQKQLQFSQHIERAKTPIKTTTTSTKLIQEKQPLPEPNIQQLKTELQKFNQQIKQIVSHKVNFASFDIIKVLGQGTFGKVYLAKHIKSGKQYALKALKKKKLILQKQIKYALTQSNILKQTNNPFIINLYYTFQTLNSLYLALDYCPGKDLSFHIARQMTFSQEQSKFYIAEIILAIEYLHSKKIIYRDLKPENILLNYNGHIKLADFGLSKQVEDTNNKTKSFCGSPAYLSPEMLLQEGAGKQSDLYGIGAILYQFLIGQPPFFSEDINILYKNIREGKLKFNKNISDNAKNLIKGLLERNPKKRLGYNGMSQIKKHPFFAQINWQKLSNLQVEPPKRLQIEKEEDSQDQLEYIQNKNGTKFIDTDYDQLNQNYNRINNFSFTRLGTP